eukprot:SAG22_NODE_2672_length_2317_cov_6.085212_3_plen_71_part_00
MRYFGSAPFFPLTLSRALTVPHLAMGLRYGPVPVRWGFQAANAALDVFNSLSTGVNVCVLSNGGLLERQQ